MYITLKSLVIYNCFPPSLVTNSKKIHFLHKKTYQKIIQNYTILNKYVLRMPILQITRSKRDNYHVRRPVYPCVH